jgi:hypothetical protein
MQVRYMHLQHLSITQSESEVDQSSGYNSELIDLPSIVRISMPIIVFVLTIVSPSCLLRQTSKGCVARSDGGGPAFVHRLPPYT